MKHHYRLPLRRTPPGGSDYALALLLALGGALPASAADAPAPAEEAPPLASSVPDKADTALGKVTVTARRREEDSQKVPTPITVLGGETLEAQRISRVQDLQQVLPSVNVAYIHARQSSVAVRGIGNNPASDGLEGSAGIYLDNVYLGRPGMAVFDLLDIEQLELLRGPQGTLFGKNTTAGVLNISTRAPTFTAERTVEVSGGQDGYFQGRGTVSGPLGETLAGRLSAYRTRDDGYIKNIHDDNYLNGASARARAGNCCSSRTRTSACAGSPTTTRRIRATAAWWSTAAPSVSGSAPRWSALRRCAIRSAGRSTSTAASTSACTRAAARWRPTGTSPAATA